MNQHRSVPEQLAAQAEMFGNRLAKNAKQRTKWARRVGVGCYRLYDRDIPEVPLALDWYEGRLHISHYLGLDREKDPAWLEAMVKAASERLSLSSEQVFVKERKRQKGADQYERMGELRERFSVAEGECSFWVDLGAYLDTGLFLDHRDTRALVAKAARGKRLLNLFSYTGSFSVQAAQAGALETISVDLSKTYSGWARENFALNELPAARNVVIDNEVFEYLSRARTDEELFDVIVVDPPIFSNSKRMSVSFDVQRDHVELLHATATVCRRGAEVFFSTSRRKFKLDDEALSELGFRVEEITSKTVPRDFQQRRPHRCWKLAFDGAP